MVGIVQYYRMAVAQGGESFGLSWIYKVRIRKPHTDRIPVRRLIWRSHITAEIYGHLILKEGLASLGYGHSHRSPPTRNFVCCWYTHLALRTCKHPTGYTTKKLLMSAALVALIRRRGYQAHTTVTPRSSATAASPAVTPISSASAAALAVTPLVPATGGSSLLLGRTRRSSSPTPGARSAKSLAMFTPHSGLSGAPARSRVTSELGMLFRRRRRPKAVRWCGTGWTARCLEPVRRPARRNSSWRTAE